MGTSVEKSVSDARRELGDTIQLMEEIGISESRRVRGLGANQVHHLLDHFSDR